MSGKELSQINPEGDTAPSEVLLSFGSRPVILLYPSIFLSFEALGICSGDALRFHHELPAASQLPRLGVLCGPAFRIGCRTHIRPLPPGIVDGICYDALLRRVARTSLLIGTDLLLETVDRLPLFLPTGRLPPKE